MRRKFYNRNFLVYFILLVIFTLLIISNSFSYLSSIFSDRLYGNQAPLNNILIIAIDDISINTIGRWPWQRDVFAQLLPKISDAKAIGIDVSFFENSYNDSSLNSTLNSMNNVVLASEINNDLFFKPIFNVSHGYVNLLTDSDGVTRSFQLGLSEDFKETTMPFAFEVYKKYSSVESYSQARKIINFAGEPGSFDSISFYEALNSKIDSKNRIILIGATAPNLHDSYFVPTSNGISMPGVEIHANIIQNILLDNFLNEQGNLSLIVLVIITSILGFFLLSRIKIYYAFPLVIFIIFLYGIMGIYLFNIYNYLLDLFYVPLSLFVFTFAGIAMNYLEEKKQRAYLTDAFGKYVSKDLLSEIISKKHQLKLGGAKREITVFFSDIRKFTTISEKLPPEKLVRFVNEYFTEMTKIIMENKGTVDKFVGDAIMAFWNAPFLEKDHSRLACNAAVSQIRRLRELQKSWKKRNLPILDIGCGIHTGEAIIGNLGSEDRFDYTAMGDSVNLSSRLEGLTKQYGVKIIISESTYKNIKSEFKCRMLDVVKVKGKKLPIRIYELIVDDNSKTNLLISKFENAFNLYSKSKFKKAKLEFEGILKMKKDDFPSKVFIERCNKFLDSPPGKSWDGSFESKEK